MIAPAHRTADYLGHMLDAIERIRRYTSGVDLAGFKSQSLIQDAVIRNIEIVGEAVRNISRKDPEFIAAHPEVPWTKAIQTRDRVSHGYATVELEIIWATIQRDLPAMEIQASALLDALRRA